MARHTFRARHGSSVAVHTGDEDRAAAGCFADEVVIDFPSPARAIDRMRHAFVGEDRAQLTADLRLSTREAGDGAVVPLHVPVPCTCRACGGRGEAWPDRCAHCAGSGVEVVHHEVDVSVPAGTREGDRFHFVVSARHDVSTRIELHVRIS
jgi:hypothetical protein